MTKAKITKQLMVTTPNEVGTLDKISVALKNAGLNIFHLCASAMAENAHFMLVVNDVAKATHVLEGMEYEVLETEVLEIEFENAPGTLSPVAAKLAEAGIDIKYIYGTTGEGSKIVGILSTNDNQRAIDLINS